LARRERASLKEHRFDRTEKNLEGGGTFDNRIAIRVNAGQGSDAILGKAERKFYAALLEHLSGEPVDSGDADDAIDVESSPAKPKRSEEYAAKLGQCESKSHVGPIAKQAGGDWRLAGETRKKVMEWCAARRKEL
jgi:hypothetical protein